MAPSDTIKWVVLSASFLATNVSCVENNSGGVWAEFRSLDELTKSLNQLALQAKLPKKVVPGRATARKVIQTPVLMGAPENSQSRETPSVSGSNINSQAEASLGFLSKTGPIKSSLPLAEARVVKPVRETWSSKDFTETPWTVPTNQKERDVVATFTPPFTRFGTDRYDKGMFDSSNGVTGNALTDDEASSDGSGRGMGQLYLAGESLPEGEKKKKTPEQEARENLQKTMKEFAERDDEKEAFQLVDYFDLRNVLSRNSHLLSSFESDDIDERFIKNAQIVFERFGGRDNAPDRKPFEVFLKKMEPPHPYFKASNFEKISSDRKRSRH